MSKFKQANTIGISSMMLMAAFAGNLNAQEADTLETIVVVGTRSEQALGQIPSAVSVVDSSDIQLGRQELGLDEALARVPGVVMQNRYNFAQDLRVSIRGFGSRANFGIRGIKVIADGIPVTLADGQSGTDDLDIGSVERIEIIRGPSASLYGAASGGVMNLTTEDGPEESFFDAKFTVGEYGHQKVQFKTGGQSGRLNYLVNVSRLEMDGYRDHSEVEHSLINSKFRYDIDDTSDITLILNAADSPEANDSGGITLSDVDADRDQAQARNLSSNAGESFDQQRIGLVYNKSFSETENLTLRGYSLWKDFEAFLPIGTHIRFVGDDGVVDYSRDFYGGGVVYTFGSMLGDTPLNITLGADIDIQEDDRRRFLNNAGVKGSLSFDQMEEAESLGAYIRGDLALTDDVTLSIGGRYDNIDLDVNDKYLVNGDQSGSLDFDEFSPTLGLIWQASDSLALYSNFSTSFETPTFTELGTPARDLDVNLGGFSNVSAQEAESIEFGAKGTINDNVYFDIALFTMDVSDEISNIESIANRAFFENADTDRNGLEAQLQASLTEGLDLTLSYTYSDFEFDDFPGTPAAEGEWLPGIPRHQYYAELSYTHSSGAYVVIDALNVGKYYGNNTNTVKIDSYVVSNLRMGNSYEFNDVTVSPFFGINNLFDEDYFSNVRNNAFGGRAYEPAPERHIYGGVNIRF